MMEVIARNNNYRNSAVRLYELGKIYIPRDDGLADEPKMLALGAYGDGADFFTFKGTIEEILRAARIGDVRFDACRDNPSYHPGRCAAVYAGDKKLGVFGQIHPLVAASYGVETEVFAAELSFEALYGSHGGKPEYRPLPKFPAVDRDIAVVCNNETTIAQLTDCIKRAGGELLRSVKLFDIYTGSHIPEGKKSTAFSLRFRSNDKTLTDTESDDAVRKVLDKLAEELGAFIR